MDLGFEISLTSMSMNLQQLFTVDLGKKFTPYPYFIVHDFEAILKKKLILQRQPTLRPVMNMFESGNKKYSNPRSSVHQFIENIQLTQERTGSIELQMYPEPSDFHMLPETKRLGKVT